MDAHGSLNPSPRTLDVDSLERFDRLVTGARSMGISGASSQGAAGSMPRSLQPFMTTQSGRPSKRSGAMVRAQAK